MIDKFDDFDIGPQSDEMEDYTIYDAWLDYERTLNQQAEWVQHYIKDKE